MNMRTTIFLYMLATLAITACAADDSAADGGSSGADSSGSGSATQSSTMSTAGPSTENSMSASDPSATESVTDPTGPDSSGPGPDSSSSGGETGSLECPYTPVDGTPAIGLQLVANGFNHPVQVVGHPTEPDRLFVVEQKGAIRILEPGMTTAPEDAFLEWPVGCGQQDSIGCEQGLLGFAFHPDFPEDPRVYISFSVAGQLRAQTRVAEFSLAEGDPNHVDPESFRVIIDGAKPFGNHNGGALAFGPDGYLYLGLGDGGDGFDTAQTGRNTGVILAKILRIGVEPDGTPDNPVACISDPPQVICDDLGPFDYTIPPDNPFVGDDNFAPEIHSWGWRNPWRFSFDPANGDLWVGDVGQDEWEEVDVAVAGRDYGWSAMEGNHCENDGSCDESAAPGQPNADEQYAPLFEYNHIALDACSITGGGVYRSCEVPAWDGTYLYGDFCNGRIYGLEYDGTTATDLGELVQTDELVSGSGHDAYGNVYFTTFDGIYGGPLFDGLVYRVAPM